MITNWYYLYNGHLYLFLDEETNTLKYSRKIDWFRVDRYMFNIRVSGYMDRPGFYFNLYNKDYDKIPYFDLVCKCAPDKVVLPCEWNTSSPIMLRDSRVKTEYEPYDKMYWFFKNYNDWFLSTDSGNINANENKDIIGEYMNITDTFDFYIDNLLFSDREKNVIYGLNCSSQIDNINLYPLDSKALRFVHVDKATVDFANNTVDYETEYLWDITDDNTIIINSTNIVEHNNTIYLTTINEN